MLSLEPEIQALRESGVLGDAAAARMISVERRRMFSLHYELRATIYAGLLLIVAGVGLIIRTNVDRIGPATLVAAIAIAAVICYSVPFFSRPGSNTSASPVFLEYALLLGALLMSADVGYAVNHYDLLGDHWRLEFLILSVFHGVCAYYFSSRTLLAVAITALASWLGISDSGVGTWLDAGAKSADLANRGLLCAAVILVWQQIHIRLHSLPEFVPVFAHFIANVALLASLSMVADANREVAGLLLVLIFGTLAVLYGVRSRREPFVIYGVGYALVGLDFFMLDRRIHTGALVAAWLLISTAVAAVLIFRIHRSFRSEA